MAKKKAAKKKVSKKMAKKGAVKPASRKKVAKKSSAKKPPAKKTTSKKVSKKSSHKKAASKSAKAVSRKKVPAQRAAVAKKSARPKRAPRLKANERLEKLAVDIETQKSGDLVVTESAGGSIKVHHTVHPGANQTAIPGTSYDDLKELGAGTHEIEVKRSVEMPPATAAEM